MFYIYFSFVIDIKYQLVESLALFLDRYDIGTFKNKAYFHSKDRQRICKYLDVAKVVKKG